MSKVFSSAQIERITETAQALAGELKVGPAGQRYITALIERLAELPADIKASSYTVSSLAEQQFEPAEWQALLDQELASDKPRSTFVSFCRTKVQNGTGRDSDKGQPWGDIFAALLELCGIDREMATAKHIGQVSQAAQKMLANGYSAEDVQSFGDWWRTCDFRGKKGQAPTLGQLRERWGVYRKWQKQGRDFTQGRQQQPAGKWRQR